MDVLVEGFRSFAIFINSDWNFFAATSLLCIALTIWRKDYSRLPSIGAVIALSFLLALALKGALGVERPCIGATDGVLPCPESFSLPSVHTAVAFGFVAATVGLRTFPLYFIWGLLVALSRIFLGVHTPLDVAAGFALAIFSTSIIDSLGISDKVFSNSSLFAPHRSARTRAPDEFSRKAVQAAIGICVLGAGFLLGIEAAVLLCAYCLAFGLIIFHLKSTRFSMPLIDALLSRLERPGEPAGFGALNFFVGLLIALALVPYPALALSTVYVLSISDGAAAFFGRRGRRGLPHHPGKTYLGTIAFFASALPVFFIGGAGALAMAALAAIIESLPLGLDDNLTIPWAGVIVYSLRIFA